jgi:hypothetical protein
VRSGAGWEKVGRRVWPRLAGVHIVDATKSMYAMVPPAKSHLARRVLSPVRNAHALQDSTRRIAEQ